MARDVFIDGALGPRFAGGEQHVGKPSQQTLFLRLLALCGQDNDLKSSVVRDGHGGDLRV